MRLWKDSTSARCSAASRCAAASVIDWVLSVRYSAVAMPRAPVATAMTAATTQVATRGTCTVRVWPPSARMNCR
jgi:hypothetical protein